MFKRILVAVDESEESHHALRTGLELASALGSEMVVASVSEPISALYFIGSMAAPSLPAVERRDEFERTVSLTKDALAEAKSRGVQVRSVIVEANEVEGLLGAVQDVQADLLVLGFKPHHRTIEWAGTVRRIADGIRCPILAVNKP